MSRPYLHNHVFPRAVLEQHWSENNPEAGFRGCHVFDLRTGKTRFAKGGTGKKAYSFAVQKDLYVPRVDGSRATGAERWLGGFDGLITSLVREGLQGKFDVQERDVAVLLMALWAFNYRSPYVIRSWLNAMEADPALRAAITDDTAMTSEQVVIENLVNLTTDLASRSVPCRIATIQLAEGEEFILADRPFVDWGRQQVVVLAPRLAVSLEAAERVEVNCLSAYEGMGEFINQQIALRSRCWMVAQDRATLDRWSRVVGSPEWESNRRSEQVVVEVPQRLEHGWTIAD